MSISTTVRTHLDQQVWIRQMFEEAQKLRAVHGEHGVFDLSGGNPTLEPPEAYHKELRALAASCTPGIHRYMPNAGLQVLRQGLAESLSERTGCPFSAESIVITCGAAGALNVIIRSIVDAGDEIILFRPYFVDFPYYVQNHAAVVRYAPTDDHFLPDITALRRILSPRTKAVLINVPNNPTGVLYPELVLEQVAEALLEAERIFGSEIYLIVDEAYEFLCFDGKSQPSPARFYDRTLVAGSFSKALSIPGERLGYAAVPKRCPDADDLVSAMIFANRTLGFVNAPATIQHLVHRLIDKTVSVKWYQDRRDRLCHALKSAGYEFASPEGAFFVFPRTSIPDDLEFARKLKDLRTLVSPGTIFGAPGYFRACFCVDEWVIEGAIQALSRVASELRSSHLDS